ncbi:MAG: 4Fe-4S binding protein, partial [Candidatus Latescibacteria bacterium]|nr:4Fe-4S binding protein [Candidatus Latescibacterota bacterium]
ALCSDCGLCVEVCPTNTLGYSKVYDDVGYKRSDFVYDLIEPWADKEEAALERLREIEAKQAEERAKRAAAKKAAKKVVKKVVKKPAAASSDNPSENDDA